MLQSDAKKATLEKLTREAVRNAKGRREKLNRAEEVRKAMKEASRHRED